MTEFQNDWQEIADTPAHQFRSLRFGELYDRAGCWHIDGPTSFIVRVENVVTKTVSEKKFASIERAAKYFHKNAEAGNYVVGYNYESMTCTEEFVSIFDDDDVDD